MENLLIDAIALTLFGMSFVFVFLTLMVFLTFFMSKLIRKMTPDLAIQGTANIGSNEINTDTKLIIEKVIRMHIGD